MNLSAYLDKNVKIVIDRPLGSKHPKYGFVYETNYGYVPDTRAPDGEEIDAYLLGIDRPISEYIGKCIGVIHRLDDEDDKLVIVSKEAENLSDEEIISLVSFQERFFDSQLIRK